MTLRPTCLALGFTFAQVVSAAETPAKSEPLSPVRQHLRDSLIAKLPPKPAEIPSPIVAKPEDKPVLLPAFVVTEDKDKKEKRAREIVEGQKAMEVRLSYHPLFKTERLEILRKPRMDEDPPRSGMPRLKLDILNLKW